jgi:esterase/lipase superfamily enzyme/Flp pilus assembly protein TadD
MVRPCRQGFWLSLFTLISLTFASNVVLAAASDANRLYGEAIQLRLEQRYTEAVSKARAAIDEAKASNVPQEKPEFYATYLQGLGELLLQTSDFNAALTVLEEALRIRRDADPEKVAESSLSVGRLFEDLGRFSEAEPRLIESVNALQQKFEADPSDVSRARLAVGRSSLGDLYRQIGRYELAAAELGKALELNEGLPSNERKSYVAQSKYMLAILNRDKGLPRDAEPLARAAVAAWNDDPSHRQSLASALLLHADILRGEGRLKQAEAEAKQALDIRNKEFGGDSLRAAGALNILGAIQESLERFPEAEVAYREALRIRSAKLPADHPDLATSNARLGGLLKSRGRLPEAEVLLQEALRIRESKLGVEHPDTVRSLDALGDLMRRSDRPDRAKALFERADPYRKRAVYQVRIIFGTNRSNSAPADKQTQFSGEESKDQSPTIGMADVLVPDVRAGKAAASERVQTVSLKAADIPKPEEVTDAGHMQIREVWTDVADNVVAHGRGRIQDSQRYSRKALIFIHGFNNSFENGLVRAAQLAYDLEFDGPVYYYSWPSKGGGGWLDQIKNVFNYTPDRTASANARVPFTNFLNQAVRDAQPNSVALIAHSMGNRLLLETLTHLAVAPQQGIGGKISEIVFAAPDVPSSEFKSLTKEIQPLGNPKTLYAARNDKALQASSMVWRETPAGLIEDSASWWQFWKKNVPGEPVVAVSVEAIDVTAAGASGPLDFLNINHTQYATNLWLIDDLQRILTDSTHPPHQRDGVRFLQKQGAHGAFWQFAPVER